MQRVIRTATCVALAAFFFATLAIPAERSERGWMGVLLGRVEDGTATTRSTPEDAPTGDDRPRGVRVERIVTDGPAARAGLRAGDVITSIDGVEVASNRDLMSAVGSREPGEWLPVTVERRGDRRDVRIRLDGYPADLGRLRMRQGFIGVEAIDLPPALQEHFGAPERTGAMVHRVDAYAPGWDAGIDVGDVIFEIDGQPVRSSRHLSALVGGGGVGNRIEVRAMRDGVEVAFDVTVVEEPPEDPEDESERTR